VDRDAVLAAALGAAALAGCTRAADPPGPTSSPTPSPPPVDPDVAVLTAWYAAECGIADRYGKPTGPVLKALRANHLARADAVLDHLRVRGVVAPTPAARPPLRGKTASLVSAFRDAERALAGRYVLGLGAIRDPKVAVLGAELAAGARQHAVLLGLV
jgi:hypothetical protein